ncbi:hypothetical protein ACQ4PT_025874 [Festuca glaucescens]
MILGQGLSYLLLLCVNLCFKTVNIKGRQVSCQTKCYKIMETLMKMSRMVHAMAYNIMLLLEKIKFSSMMGTATLNLVAGVKPADIYSEIAARCPPLASH